MELLMDEEDDGGQMVGEVIDDIICTVWKASEGDGLRYYSPETVYEPNATIIVLAWLYSADFLVGGPAMELFGFEYSTIHAMSSMSDWARVN